jgi:hypothetical protein
MNNTEYLTLDYESIVKKYPMSVRAITTWLLGRKDVAENMQYLLDDAKLKGKTPEEMFSENIVPPIVQFDPRKLYDFFDYHKIWISTRRFRNLWEAEVEPILLSSSTENRIEAERQGFIIAFEGLEKRLQFEKLKP